MNIGFITANKAANSASAEAASPNPFAFPGSARAVTINPNDWLSSSLLTDSAPPSPAAMLSMPPLPAPAGTTAFSYDGDAKADVSRWNATSREWRVRSSQTGMVSTVVFGNPGSVLVPADYDGDGKTDYATFTASSGAWIIKQSSNGATVNYTLGQSGDKPVAANYDTDARADAAVWRPSNGTWYVRKSSNGQTVSQQFGQAGDIPVVGNYDGDTRADYAVFRPTSNGGFWHVSNSSNGAYAATQWGAADDIPVPADFDGDGKTDYAVFRRETGTWFALKSGGTGGAYLSLIWGNYGDQPVPADYDGDAKADFAVWRPSTGVWYIANSGYPAQTGSTPYSYYQLGASGDVPTPAAYLKAAGFTVAASEVNAARLSPKNAVGGTNLYSRNFGWGTGLVSLPGRAGLDLGLGLSYNSLVWTKVGTGMFFDVDYSNVSPGFRFGFPVIEPSYLDAQTMPQQFAYLMVSPSGKRTVLRQTAASGVYESTDSSYLQMITVGSTNPNDPPDSFKRVEVRSTDGTLMTFKWIAGAFRCTEVKDANGNFITIVHDTNGLLKTITDTLGRVVTVNYDDQLYPISITQPWATGTHTWATFTYTYTSINPSFAAGLTNYGPASNAAVKVLEKVTFADGGSSRFDYNSYGQVYRVNQFAADNHKLNHTAVNLETPASGQADCPRFIQTKTWAENFNNNQEVVTPNVYQENATLPGGGTATLVSVTAPDGATIDNSYMIGQGPGEAQPFYSETCTASPCTDASRKRWVWTTWARDSDSVSYPLNPRQTSVTVSDWISSRKTEIDYYVQSAGSSVSLFGLVKEIRERNGSTNALLRRTALDYQMAPAYTSRRIIGLPAKQELYDADGTTLLSKVTYNYDEGNFGESSLQQTIAPVQHDAANYGASFVIGRGNLTSTTRHDVTGQTSAVTTNTKYNTAGAAVAQITPGSQAGTTRETKISYADAFVNGSFQADTVTRNAFAYPSKITDPAGNFSTIKYRFDIGANVKAQSPAPAGQTTGKITTRTFDTIGRLSRETIVNSGAYTRYEYPTSQNYSRVFSTVTDFNNNGQADAADEVLAENYLDGAGRSRAIRSEHPGSAGGWSSTLTEYDVLGRVKRQSVPTEINLSWNPAGDDATRGFLWQSQQYDWKSRTTRTVNTDGTDSLISYEGCGCAGGEVTTVRSEQLAEGRRIQKVYSDILGREFKNEVLNWNSTVFSTTFTRYNARDQVERIRKYSGSVADDNSCPTGTCQETIMSYDGHGRLATQHRPEQDTGKNTVYEYYQNDELRKVRDAREAAVNYIYNNRGLVTNVSYSAPAGPNIRVPGAVAFDYDAAGKRMWMTDELGRVDYEYDQLSRTTAETRQFNDSLAEAPLSNNRYKLEYSYALSGQLKSLTDPWSKRIDYAHDKIGRLSSVTGTPFVGVTTYASNAQYRAWGALKHLTYGNSTEMSITAFSNRLQAANFEVKRGGTPILKKNYQYYGDGSLRYSQDLVNARFDRLYQYDHVGRTIEARSGAEARGQTETNFANLPYRHSFVYNVFDNTTQSVTKHFTSQIETVNTNYLNNRRMFPDGSPLPADAEGNQLAGEMDTTYDAISRVAENYYFGPRTDYYEFRERIVFDGNGQTVKRTRTQDSEYGLQTEIQYSIRSSVLGGEIVSEANNSGQKLKTYVRANGTVVAEQQGFGAGEAVYWKHKDPSMASLRQTNPSGQLSYSSTGELHNAQEFDPLGQEVGQTDPYVTSSPPDTTLSMIAPYPAYSTMGPGRTYSFVLDGIPVSVPVAVSALESNLAIDYGGGIFGFAELSKRMSMREVGYNARPWYGRRVTGSSSEAGDVIRIGTTEQTIRIGTIYEPVYNSSWSASIALIGALQQSQQQTTYSDVQALRTEFQRRLNLNSGKCKEKLNELLGALGKKFDDQASKTTGIEALAERFLGGQKGYQLLEATTASGGIAEYGGGKITFQPGSTITRNGGDFLHELLHAAGGRSGSGFSHNDLVRAIGVVDGLNFKPLAKDLVNDYNAAKAAGTLPNGQTKAGYLDLRYTRIMNNWIGNYCGYEGGFQPWKDFSNQY